MHGENTMEKAKACNACHVLAAGWVGSCIADRLAAQSLCGDKRGTAW